jgi:hypothetical protein
MKQVIHIFCKDVRHLWREIAVSLALIAIYVWSEPATWVATTAATGVGSIAGWMPLLLPVSWWLLVVRVVQDEGLVGDRQFWVTRPYEWVKLLAAKLLFIAVFVSVPLLMAQFALLWLAEFPPASAHLPGILWMQGMWWMFVLLPLMVLAAVTTGIGQMTLAILGIVLCVQLITYGLSGFSRGVSQAEQIPEALGYVVLLGSCAAVTIWQYARRRAATARIALGCAVLSNFLIGAAAPHRALVERAYPEAASAQAPAQIKFDPVKPPPPKIIPSKNKKELIVFQIPLQVAGLAADSMATANGNRVEIEGPGGFRWDAGWGPDQMRWRAGEHFRYTLMLEPAVYARVQDSPVKLRISFALTAFNNDEKYDVAVPDGEFAVKNLGLCELQNPGQIQCRYALRRPPFLVATSFAASTCPARQGAPPPSTAKVEQWELENNVGPAEFGISPVHTINISLQSGPDSPRVCVGTPVTFTFPRETGRVRATVVIEGVRLSEYRRSSDPNAVETSVSH